MLAFLGFLTVALAVIANGESKLCAFWVRGGASRTVVVNASAELHPDSVLAAGNHKGHAPVVFHGDFHISQLCGFPVGQIVYDSPGKTLIGFLRQPLGNLHPQKLGLTDKVTLVLLKLPHSPVDFHNRQTESNLLTHCTFTLLMAIDTLFRLRATFFTM